MPLPAIPELSETIFSPFKAEQKGRTGERSVADIQRSALEVSQSVDRGIGRLTRLRTDVYEKLVSGEDEEETLTYAREVAIFFDSAASHLANLNRQAADEHALFLERAKTKPRQFRRKVGDAFLQVIGDFDRLIHHVRQSGDALHVMLGEFKQPPDPKPPEDRNG